jgi:hypothetical protein
MNRGSLGEVWELCGEQLVECERTWDGSAPATPASGQIGDYPGRGLITYLCTYGGHHHGGRA